MNRPTSGKYAVFCRSSGWEGEGIRSKGCGLVYLTDEEYHYQMNHPNSTWQCPKCGSYDAYWDDDTYETYCEAEYHKAHPNPEDDSSQP